MAANVQEFFTVLFPCFFLLLSFYYANSEPFIGVNYGIVANNLPPPEATAKLLQSTSIEKVRLYGADPAIIKALANTDIGIVVGAANGEIQTLASDPNSAQNWVRLNVLPYYPASKIIVVTVGNEVMTSLDQNPATWLLRAMQNVQSALNAASLGGKVKVSTVHSMEVLSQSDPPSSGAFKYGDTMKQLLKFLSDNGAPFMINPYPFFAYKSDPRPETLAFCLFQPNAGRVDSGTRYNYMNMFDAQVDGVYSALKEKGFEDIEIVVAETGWPYRGDSDEVGVSLDNAKAYNGNLIKHLRSNVGTPRMPGKSVDTYIFALYDEDLKPGPGSERAFGLYSPDLTAIYDAGLLKSTQTPAPTPSTPAPTTPVSPAPTIPVAPINPSPTTPVGPVNPSPTTPTTPVNHIPSPSAGWCVPRPGIPDAQLQENLDYACGRGIDCSSIQPGGACFEPTTVSSHAAYAMNLLYQSAGRNPWNCDFMQTATLTSTNPIVTMIAFILVKREDGQC
ncbi:Glucan endo-1,3-beta-D-glucosidase [Orobanche hederae]